MRNKVAKLFRRWAELSSGSKADYKKMKKRYREYRDIGMHVEYIDSIRYKVKEAEEELKRNEFAV